MANIIEHPLIRIKLSKMREGSTDHTLFSKNLNEIASLMVYEVFRDYKPREEEMTAATGYKTTGFYFDREIVIVPILRAGLGMVRGIQDLVPQSRVGHIGLYRDEETFEVHDYFYKIPKVDKKSSEMLVVDPMLATGGSAIDAVDRLKKDGFTNIKLICLVGAPEGVKTFEEKHPDVEVFLASMDEKLDENKYIVPGLGDAGDRIFGTK